jgi:acetolactate synthase I/II/III large subunit
MNEVSDAGALFRRHEVDDPVELHPILKRAVEAGEPTLVDIVCQPLREAKAPVSEWAA